MRETALITPNKRPLSLKDSARSALENGDLNTTVSKMDELSIEAINRQSSQPRLQKVLNEEMHPTRNWTQHDTSIFASDANHYKDKEDFRVKRG